jgi:DNA-binding transcriptional MerR regulator
MTAENVNLEPLKTIENNEIGAKLPPSREEKPFLETENSSVKTLENYVFKDGKAFVGHSLALKLTGSNPATLHRYTKAGKLSYDKDENGHKIYQVAELERVFQKLKPMETSDNVSNEGEREQLKTTEADFENALKIANLESENRKLEILLEAEREKGRLLERNADDLRQAMKMLTYRPEPVPQPTAQTQPIAEPAAQPKKKFLGIFGGR